MPMAEIAPAPSDEFSSSNAAVAAKKKKKKSGGGNDREPAEKESPTTTTTTGCADNALEIRLEEEPVVEETVPVITPDKGEQQQPTPLKSGLTERPSGDHNCSSENKSNKTTDANNIASVSQQEQDISDLEDVSSAEKSPTTDNEQTTKRGEISSSSKGRKSSRKKKYSDADSSDDDSSYFADPSNLPSPKSGRRFSFSSNAGLSASVHSLQNSYARESDASLSLSDDSDIAVSGHQTYVSPQPQQVTGDYGVFPQQITRMHSVSSLVSTSSRSKDEDELAASDGDQLYSGRHKNVYNSSGGPPPNVNLFQQYAAWASNFQGQPFQQFGDSLKSIMTTGCSSHDTSTLAYSEDETNQQQQQKQGHSVPMTQATYGGTQGQSGGHLQNNGKGTNSSGNKNSNGNNLNPSRSSGGSRTRNVGGEEAINGGTSDIKSKSVGFDSPEGHESEEHGDGKFKVYWQRWIMLFYMSVLNLLSDWTCYSMAPIALLAQEAFGEIDPELCVTIFLGANAVASACEPMLLARLGLRRTVLFGALLLMVGSIVKSGGMPPIIEANVGNGQGATQVYLGFVIVGLSQPLYQCTPALLSASWFPETERTLATGVALNANQLGIGFAFVFGTLLVHTSEDIADYFGLLSMISTLAFVGTLFQFDDAPPTPPSDSAKVMRGTVEVNLTSILQSVRAFGSTDEADTQQPVPDASKRPSVSPSPANMDSASLVTKQKSGRSRSRGSSGKKSKRDSSGSSSSKGRRNSRKQTAPAPSPAHYGSVTEMVRRNSGEQTVPAPSPAHYGSVTEITEAPSPMMSGDGPPGANPSGEQEEGTPVSHPQPYEQRREGEPYQHPPQYEQPYAQAPPPPYAQAPPGSYPYGYPPMQGAPPPGMPYAPGNPPPYDLNYQQPYGFPGMQPVWDPRIGQYVFPQQYYPPPPQQYMGQMYPSYQHDPTEAERARSRSVLPMPDAVDFGAEPIITMTDHHLDVDIEDDQVIRAIRACFARPGFIHTLVAFTVSGIVINTLSTYMDYLVTLNGAPRYYTGLIGGSFQGAIMISSLIVGQICDHTRAYYSVMLFMLVIGAFALAECGVSLDADRGSDLRWALIITAILVGPLQPVSTEMGVDVVYPLSENTVLVIQQLFSNMLSSLFIPVFKLLKDFGRDAGGRVKPQFTFSFYLLIVLHALATIFVATFNGRYLRYEHELEKKAIKEAEKNKNSESEPFLYQQQYNQIHPRGLIV